MKLTPQQRRIAERMAPGALCREGFLGGDARPLADILSADRAAVEAMGLTHADLAGRLAAILHRAMAAPGRAVSAAPDVAARYREAMGRIPCPWGGCGVFPKGEVELTRAGGRRMLRFTPLSVHLIAAHGFYQGRGSPYRLEPAELADWCPPAPSAPGRGDRAD
jgi:hypothetical protein